MGLESHVSLELAKRIKIAMPAATTILGGSHFGAIPEDLISLFSFVDFVVSGEGENPLRSILSTLEEPTNELEWSLPSNVFFRQDDIPCRGRRPTEAFDLNVLPFPAYDLVDVGRYFSLNHRQVINYEAGRGCVFSCAFCYSPGHYHGARDKRPELILLELCRLTEAGARHIFFVDDNFVNSPRWARALCELIIKAQLPLQWSCYATLPQINDDLIDLFSLAGCRGIFFGIDAVSEESQIAFAKNFARKKVPVLKKLQRCVEQGITPTCAFILDVSDDADTFNQTISLATECRALGCDVHLNALSIYSGTPLSKQQSSRETTYSTLKASLLLDSPPVVIDNQFAEEYPLLFPLHVALGDITAWQSFLAKLYTLFAGLYALPDSLQHTLNEEKLPASILVRFADDRFCKILCDLPVKDRRLWAVKTLFDYLATESKGISKSLSREWACLLLSSQGAPTSLQLVVDGASREVLVSRFLDLATYREQGAFQGEWEFALLEEEDGSAVVKFMQVPLLLGHLLRRLLSRTGSASIEVTKEEFARLVDEGWIHAITGLEREVPISAEVLCEY
jgi:hypothetical protein